MGDVSIMTPSPHSLNIAEPQDFISRYLNYVGYTEVPLVFHRWSAIAGIGALLGKSVWFEHGAFKVYPNMYVQLFGEAGSRKSTGIKLFGKILRSAGFQDFAAEKTSKEKFIEWMADRAINDEDAELWGELGGSDTCNVLISADEFNDFFSTNILDFLSFLGVMWDYEGDYEHSTRSGGTVKVSNPCISILSGNTPTTFAKTIPPEAIGQGFFSRVVGVFAEPTGIRIAFPVPPTDEATEAIAAELASLKAVHSGPMIMTPEAMELLESIYLGWKGLDDPRFNGYGNRRFNQLLKLTIIHTIAAHTGEVDIIHVLRANTVLTRVEADMSKALGEFGLSKNAAVNSTILAYLDKCTAPVSIQELWGLVHQDLDRMDVLANIVSGLVRAGKVVIEGEGLLPRRVVQELEPTGRELNSFLDWGYLSEQERELIK